MGCRIEWLESRVLLSNYYVAPNGSDQADGSAAAPWATLQNAANHVAAGDTVTVAPGQYAGFVLGWDTPVNGTADQPITFLGQPGATITTRNNKTPDGIDLESDSYITVQGFTITGMGRAGIRATSDQGIVLKDNVIQNCYNWGIFTSFSDNLLIQGNSVSGTIKEHGIYVSNGCVNPVIRNNTLFDNAQAGIQLNGDASQGGSGVITHALIRGNVLYNNGRAGASAINCDGMQGSRIINNLLYGNHASGISLYLTDAGQASINNKVVNNTIMQAADGGWAINIKSNSVGNKVLNNILRSPNPGRGAINVMPDSLAGLVSDYNIIQNRFTTDNGRTIVKLADWQQATGQDAHSFATPAQPLFRNMAAGDYRLAVGSLAIGRGTPTFAPVVDLRGKLRQGGFDIGAYWYRTPQP